MCFLTIKEILYIKLCIGNTWTNIYIKIFIYIENGVRLVLFTVLLWPLKFNLTFFFFFIFLFMVSGRWIIFICSADTGIWHNTVNDLRYDIKFENCVKDKNNLFIERNIAFLSWTKIYFILGDTIFKIAKNLITSAFFCRGRYWKT